MKTLVALAIAVGAAAAPLTRAQLESFTYDLGASSSVEGGKVPIADGKWVDPQGGSTFSLHPLHAIGDLDGDANADAIAILVEATGGTGSFHYLFALMNRDGAAIQLQFSPVTVTVR